MAKKLTVGSFQFAATSDIGANLAALERGIQRAVGAGVRLLLTQECGLCGYPPVEREAASSVDQVTQRRAIERVSDLAMRHGLYIIVGLITADGPSFRNTLCLLGPDGARRMYHKRALWGWDAQSFVPGDEPGVHEVDGIRVGMRICYEARFPEYFRELFRQSVDLALVALSNVGEATDRRQAEVYRSHLVSRASENAIWVLSANSTSRAQLAPSCLIDRDGYVTAECRADQEELLVGNVEVGAPGLGTRGRITLSRSLNGMASTEE